MVPVQYRQNPSPAAEPCDGARSEDTLRCGGRYRGGDVLVFRALVPVNLNPPLSAAVIAPPLKQVTHPGHTQDGKRVLLEELYDGQGAHIALPVPAQVWVEVLAVARGVGEFIGRSDN